MNNVFIKKKFYFEVSIIISLILYVSFFLGFFLDENATGGKVDWEYHITIVEGFNVNFKETFENYNNRHSPIFYILSSFFNIIFITPEDAFYRFTHVSFSLFVVFFFYRCLQIKFENVNKITLFIISSFILLSPNFRTLSIWPQPIILGTILLLISIFYYLKFKKSNLENKKFKYALLNTFFLILSAYISPNFSLFVIFFLYNFYIHFNLSKKLFLIILLNLALSIPAFYYLFALDKYLNFFHSVSSYGYDGYLGLSMNFSNKVLIISSIIFFHILPFLATKAFKINYNFYKKNYFSCFAILILFSIFIYTFNFESSFGGGGIFFKISNYLLNNNIILYFFSFISIFLIFQLSYKNFNNFLLFLILVLLNPQLSIYHKYYDPLILILVFTIFSSKIDKSYLNNKKNIFLIGSYSLLFLILNFSKHYLD